MTKSWPSVLQLSLIEKGHCRHLKSPAIKLHLIAQINQLVFVGSFNLPLVGSFTGRGGLKILSAVDTGIF